MSNFLPILIGFRYSRGRNRNRFGSVVALFSLVGMAVGVCALILVLSVMNGFNAEIAGRMQTLAPDLTVFPSKNVASAGEIDTYLNEMEEVVATSPVLESFVMLSDSGLQRPMRLVGIDPKQELAVTELSEQFVDGKLEFLQPGEFGIVLGSYAASSLLLTPGDTVKVILPKLRMTPVGLFPRQKNFRLVGVFDTGSQLDADIAYVNILDGLRVLGQSDTAIGRRVKLTDLDLAETIASEIQAGEKPLTWLAKTWSSDYQSLFQAMKMEKITVGVLLMIIILVAAFNIVSGLVMMVSDKRSDMAVLRTMGASSATIVRIFVVQGLILGLSGIIAGAILGTLLALYLSSIVGWVEGLVGGSIFDPSVFYVSFLPSEWRLKDLFWVVMSAMSLTLLATLLPAMQAAKISPREALNYKQ